MALAFAVAFGGTAYAQSLTGTITGVVEDQSGAVIPNANITLTNQASLDVRRTVANKEGAFTFGAVPVGTYDVLIEVAGFKPWKRTKVVLGGGERISISEIQLAPGALTEQVTVTEQIPLAPVDSGEKVTTITFAQLQNISIVGRSAAEVIKLLPGMTPAIGQWQNPTATEEARNVAGYDGGVIGINGNGEGGRQSAVGAFSANGTKPEAMEIVLDGAHAADPGCNCATSVNPNPEMIAEIKLLSSNFSAENSKGPVALSIVSRAGGRELHGSAYVYHRGYQLNANEWALNRAGQGRPKNQFTYPGLTLGGPVSALGFNRNKDKLFFFVGAELFRQKIDTGVINAWVPTDRVKQGDFSNAADYSALGSGASSYVRQRPTNLDASGRIPSNLIDANGKVLINLLPAPNANPAATGGYNYVQAVLSDQNGNQLFTRLDLAMSDNTKAFVRYARQRETQPWAGGLWWRDGNQVPSPSKIVGKNVSDSVSATLTHVFNPKMTSETIVAYTFINFPNNYEDPSKMSRSGLGFTVKGFLHQNAAPDAYIPNFGVTDNSEGPEIRNFGDFNNFFAKKKMFSVAENVTSLIGKHTIKVGLYYEWVNNAQPGAANSNGQLNLSPQAVGSSGNYFADLLTGTLKSYNDATPNVVGDIAYSTYEGYIQDSWKVSPRLTVEGGVRLQHMPGWAENQYGVGIAVWDQSAYSASAPISALPGLRWHSKDASIPLTGVKRPFLVLAPRAGFAYDISGGKGDTIVRGGIGLFRYNEMQEFYTSTVTPNLGQQNYTTSENGIMLRDVDAYLLTHSLAAAGRSGQTALDINDTKMPGTTSWSLTLQKRLAHQMMLEASYVGNHTFGENDCGNPCRSDINTVPMGAMLSNPDGAGDDYRPMKQYATLAAVRHRLYRNYHGGQFMLSKQTGALNLMASYTFSKVLGFRGGARGSVYGDVVQANGQIIDLRQTNYGVLQNDRTHVASLSWSWLMPEIKSNSTLNTLLGGWQLIGQHMLVSGAPLQAIAGADFTLSGTLANGATITSPRMTGSPQVAVQPVLTCDPRKDLAGKDTSGNHMINASCFALPAIGSNGNYIMPHMTGQWYQNHDLSLFKNFALGGTKKIQLRVSGYNVLNLAQRYPDPTTNLRLNFDKGAISNANQFGLLPLNNKFGHRVVQVGAKLLF